MAELEKEDTPTTEISTVLGDNYLVKKSNILILAKFPPMNVFEYKLMGIATAKLTVKDLRKDGFSKVMIHSSKIMTGKHLGFLALDKIAEKITSKAVQLKKHTEKNKRMSKWVSLVSSCTIEEQSGYFTIELHRDLAAHLLELKSHFTQVPDWILMAMKDAYAIRFYEIFKMHINITLARYEKYGEDKNYSEKIVGGENLGWRITRKFQITRLHELLGIEKGSEGESYLRTDYMLGRLLPRVLKEFKKHSDFIFDFEPGKEGGRSWQYITFILRKNAAPQQLELFEAWEEMKLRTRKVKDLPEKQDESQEPDSTSVDDLLEGTDPVQPIIDIDLITKVPVGQWDTEDGCKTVCEEIATKKGLEAVEFYINFALSYPGGAKSFGKVIRFALKEELFEKHIESIKAMEKAEEVENKAKAEQDKKILFEYRAMSDREIQRLHNVGDPIAIKVWEEGRGKEIEEKEAVERENRDIELELIKNLLDTDLERFTDFAGAGSVGAAKFKRWRDQYLDTKKIPFGVQIHLASVLNDYMTHKKEQEKVSLKASSAGIEEAKHQLSELFKESTPEQREILKVMFTPEKMELVNKIINELSQPK
ncbi:MAG: replication initiation protein [Lentisphaerae bacterium]|nr:replication initiation protein [Lentisphaerota bacterium]